MDFGQRTILILVPVLVPVLFPAFLSPTATAAWSWSQLPDLNRRPMLYENETASFCKSLILRKLLSLIILNGFWQKHHKA